MATKKAVFGREYVTINRLAVPTGRNGKHNAIVKELLAKLENLESGHALKVRLSELPDTKVNIRSALSRATRKLRKNVTTAADAEFLYLWNE